MERKLVEYSQIMKENGLELDISTTELKRHFREIVPGGKIDQDELIDKYTRNYIDGDTWEDPNVLEGQPNFLARPFSFYGGYVALSTSEKEKYASRQTLFMYKNLIKDLSEANDSNMSTVKFLQEIKDESEAKIKDLKGEIDRLFGCIFAKDQELTK